MSDIASEADVSAQSILVKRVDVDSSLTNGGRQCVNMTLSVLDFSGILELPNILCYVV